MGKVILREGWPPTAQTPVNPHDVYVKQLQVINETLRQRVEKLETANILVERYRTSLKNSPVVFAHVDEELRYEWIFNPHPDFDPSAVVGKRDDELDAGPGIDALVALRARRTGAQGNNIRPLGWRSHV